MASLSELTEILTKASGLTTLELDEIRRQKVLQASLINTFDKYNDLPVQSHDRSCALVVMIIRLRNFTITHSSKQDSFGILALYLFVFDEIDKADTSQCSPKCRQSMENTFFTLDSIAMITAISRFRVGLIASFRGFTNDWLDMYPTYPELGHLAHYMGSVGWNTIMDSSRDGTFKEITVQPRRILIFFFSNGFSRFSAQAPLCGCPVQETISSLNRVFNQPDSLGKRSIFQLMALLHFTFNKVLETCNREKASQCTSNCIRGAIESFLAWEFSRVVSLITIRDTYWEDETNAISRVWEVSRMQYSLATKQLGRRARLMYSF